MGLAFMAIAAYRIMHAERQESTGEWRFERVPRVAKLRRLRLRPAQNVFIRLGYPNSFTIAVQGLMNDLQRVSHLASIEDFR